MAVRNENSKPHDQITAPTCPGTTSSSPILSKPQTLSSSSLSSGLTLFSPNSKPSLVIQRDHSACVQHRQATPLRVRKTRENLRQTDYKPLPPLKDASNDLFTTEKARNSLDSTVYAADEQLGVIPHLGDGRPGLDLQAWKLGYLLAPNDMATHPTELVQRHRSISKSMLSKIRQGLSTRSKGSKVIRPIESDPALFRKMSNRRQQSNDADRRVHSLETDQNPNFKDVESFSSIGTIGTSDLLQSFPKPTGSRKVSTHSASSIGNPGIDDPTKHLQARTASADLTSYDATCARDDGYIPYIDLSISSDISIVDVASEQDVWICIEAVVRLQRMIASLSRPPTPHSTTDTILLVDVSISEHTANNLEHWLETRAPRLFSQGDRIIAFALRHSTANGAATTGFAATQMHALQDADTDLILTSVQRITSGNFTGWFEDGLRVQDLLQAAHSQGLRTSSASVMIISPTPIHLAAQLETIVSWPIHQIALGLSSVKDVFHRNSGPQAWTVRNAFDITSDDNSIIEEMSDQLHGGTIRGSIPSLRICLKPGPDCTVRDILGHRSYKNIRPGMRCELFVRVKVPKLCKSPCDLSGGLDQDSLFEELESIVGTLTKPMLSIEARYKHTLIHETNTVTVHQTISISRPQTDSRWSLSSSNNGKSNAEMVYGKLVAFIATQRSPEEAVHMIVRYCNLESSHMQMVNQICEITKREQAYKQTLEAPMSCTSMQQSKTFTEADGCAMSEPASAYSITTRPISPSSAHVTHPACSRRRQNPYHHQRSLAQANFDAPQTPKIDHNCEAVQPATMTSVSQAESSPSDQKDDARQIWRHMRKSSCTAKQLDDAGPEEVQQLEASDEELRELRRRALANKRSIGAETLKGWKWDQCSKGEASWL